jgi:hypothetical protein
MKRFVLNESEKIAPSSATSGDMAQELKSRIDNLKLDFFDLERGGVNYEGLKDSDAFEEYKAATKGLICLNLNKLSTRESKLAFWINLYNALVVHGILGLNIRQSVKEVRSFFKAVCYNVGGYIFSLDDIEHGILRGNKKKHFFARRPFSDSDSRKKFILETADPRIHFALVCGSNSCPPIEVYEEAEIDQQLDLVSEAFINSEEVAIDRDHKELKISRIFKWYREDFGGGPGLLAFLIKYRFAPEDKELLQAAGRGLRIVYNDYDWSLNLV